MAESHDKTGTKVAAHCPCIRTGRHGLRSPCFHLSSGYGNRTWTDEALYKKYALTQDEIGFIESMVRPLPAAAADTDREASDEC